MEIKKYWTNSLASGLSESMKIGTEVVLYADHLVALEAVVKEKDEQIAALKVELAAALRELDRSRRV